MGPEVVCPTPGMNVEQVATGSPLAVTRPPTMRTRSSARVARPCPTRAEGSAAPASVKIVKLSSAKAPAICTVGPSSASLSTGVMRRR